MLPVYIYLTALPGGRLGFGGAISLIMLLINLLLARGRTYGCCGRRAREIPLPADASGRDRRSTSSSRSCTAFFALPMLWLVTAPFTRTPTYGPCPDFTLYNFSALLDDPYALPSLYNSAVLSLWTC